PITDHEILRSPARRNSRRAVIQSDPLDGPVGQVDGHRAVRIAIGPDVMRRRAVGVDRKGSAADGSDRLFRRRTGIDFLAGVGYRARENRSADSGDVFGLAGLPVFPPARKPDGGSRADGDQNRSSDESAAGSLLAAHEETPDAPNSNRTLRSRARACSTSALAQGSLVRAAC